MCRHSMHTVCTCMWTQAHRGLCTCVYMHAHMCLLCSALCSSVFEKFIRRQAIPEGMESAAVLPSRRAAWVFTPPCLLLAPQRDGGRTSNGFQASSALFCPHSPFPTLRVSALILWGGHTSWPGGRSGMESPALGPRPSFPQSQGPFPRPGAPPLPSSSSSS